MAYWGRFNATNPLTLPIARAFQAAGGRQWLVSFWKFETKWVGIALPFGITLWTLFFFDHNVSVSSLLLSKPCDEIIFYISHSWLKHLNFHFENLQDSITISSFLVSLHSSQAHRLNGS